MKQRHVTREKNPVANVSNPKAKPSALKAKLTFVSVCNDKHYNFMVSLAIIALILAAFSEVYTPVAYGKFGEGAYFAVPPRVGWWLMEIPVSCTLVYFFFIKGGSQSREFVPRLMALVMCGHYIYRGWYYPYNLAVSSSSASFSLAPAVGGWIYTILHGYLSAKWFGEHGKHLNNSWLKDARFWIGLFTYYSGFVMLVWHDNIMRNLRLTPGPKYKIPYGGLYDYATSAHYFVELWTWLGFAILSWGPNGLFIFLVSCFNLIPRSVSNHAWYIEKFGDEYPADRNYLIPFVW